VAEQKRLRSLLRKVCMDGSEVTWSGRLLCRVGR